MLQVSTLPSVNDDDDILNKQKQKQLSIFVLMFWIISFYYLYEWYGSYHYLY